MQRVLSKKTALHSHAYKNDCVHTLISVFKSQTSICNHHIPDTPCVYTKAQSYCMIILQHLEIRVVNGISLTNYTVSVLSSR